MQTLWSHVVTAAPRLTVACLATAAVWALLPRVVQAQQPPPVAPGTPPPLAVSRLADPESAGPVAPAAPAGQSPIVSQAPLQPLPVTRLEEEAREAFLDAGRTFSLRIGEPQPVQDLLLLLVRDTRFSVVAAPGVGGTFVGELKDVTLEQALDLVLRPLSLDYDVDRSFIRVFPRRVETRLFAVNYVQTSRASRRELRAGGEGGSRWAVEASESADLFAELTGGVQTLLSPDGRFNLDRKAALLQVTDYPDRLDRVGLYVEAIEQRVTRQVEIRALIVEVELGAGFAAGVDWATVLTALGRDPSAARGFGTAGQALGIDLTDPSALLEALGAQGTVRVLARPRVVAMNNEPAYMRVGRRDAGFVPAPDQEPGVTEGLVLAVTPLVAADGIIQMSVSPSVTSRTGDLAAPGEATPAVSVREVDTMVRVRDGETVVISGLLEGGIDRKTDLVVLLTPALVTPAGAAGR